tara:strand:- start:378 stop:3848 length:3471 start_codon:yes stop_codon:yes gene_type:complete
MALDLEYLRQYKSQQSQPTGGPTLDLEYLRKKREEEEPSLAKIGAGFVTDIAISETARLGGAATGAAIGTAFAPGVGTAIGAGIGYVVGALGGGAMGSRVRQNIIDPNAELDQGQMVADALINLIPGVGVGKSVVKGIASQAAIGAGISGGSQVVEAIVNKEELPTLEELTKAGITGAVLGGGLGLTGKAFEKAYSKFAGMPTRNLTEAFRRGDPDAKIIVNGVEKTSKEFSDEVAKRYQDIGINIREKYDDEFIRAKLLQDISAGGQLSTKGGKLNVTSDEMDYYLQRRLAEGKIDSKLQRVEDEINLDAAFLLNKSDEIGKTTSELSNGINDYLYAKHAVAYNKANRLKFGGDGAAGISTNEAKSIISKFEDSGLDKTLKNSIDNRKNLSREILDTLEEGGLISKKEADRLRKEFPDYVPLNRIMDTDDVADAQKILTSSSTRYETLQSGVRRAFGSEREVSNIAQNIVDNLGGAVRRAEVNKANLAFVKLLRSNVDTAKNLGIKIREPKIVGTRVVKDMSEEAQLARSLGKKPKSQKVPMYERADRNVLTVFEDGKRLFVEFDDPTLARTFKGSDKREMNSILKAMYGMNRFLGGMYTRLSPEFVIPNLFRDRSEALVNNLAKMKGLQALKTLNPIDDMRVIRRNIFGGKADSPRQQQLDLLYKQFKEDGGSTGGLGLDTIKDIEKRMDELSKKLNAPTKTKVKALNDLINNINEIVEDSTRFATYRNGLASGMTRDQAAFAARNSSFDPKLKGREGDALKAIYLFSNPAIQGAKNFLRSMKNKKVAATVGGGLIAVTTALDKYNSMIDEDYRQKIPKWKLDKHLTIVRGKNEDGSLDYLSIPIGYSMVPFKMAADLTQRIARQDGELDSVKEIATSFGQAVIDSYNPMGGSPVPTILRPMTELAQNKDGLGRDIRPSWLETKNISATEQIFPWTADTQGGELAMSMADQLKDMGYEVSPENLLYLYQTYTGGPGQTVKRLLDLTSKMYNNEKINRNDVPILRRFYGRTFTDVFEKRTGDRSIIENLEKQENTESAKASRIASQILRRYNEASQFDKQFVLMEQMSRPDVNDAVRRRVQTKLDEKAKGLTSIDRQAKNLTVAKRAEYYKEKISTLPPSQVQLYIQDQIEKGVMTPRVLEVMRDTESFKQFFGQ